MPAWMQLGEFLGYDLFPTPDSSTVMRYNSQLLQSVYYIVWFILVFITSLPMLPIIHFFPKAFLIMGLPEWAGMEIGLLWVSSIYSAFLSFYRWVYLKWFYHTDHR